MDYGQKKDKIVIKKSGLANTSDKSGIFLFKSGSLGKPETAVSASTPFSIAVTCSNNVNSVLTNLSLSQSYAVITINNGDGGIGDAAIGKGFSVGEFFGKIKDTKLIFRYISSSFIPSGSDEDSEILATGDKLFKSKHSNNYYINVPIKKDDDSFTVAYRTVNALNKKANKLLYTASLIDDGTGQLGNASIGNTFIVGLDETFTLYDVN